MHRSFIKRSIATIEEKGFFGFLKKIIKSRRLDALRLFFYPYAMIKISGEIKNNFTAETAVNFVFKRFGRFLKPYQVKSEIVALAKMVEELKPKTVVEIGTSTGGTLFIWSRLSKKDAHLISIDLPGGENNWAYPLWKGSFYRKFAVPPQKMDLIRDDSQTKETLEKVRKMLDGKPIDFLFIDGDHSYQGVKKDYELYSPLVRQGGIIGFHDIVQSPVTTIVGVQVLWNEIKNGKNFKELVENWNQPWGGIGIIIK